MCLPQLWHNKRTKQFQRFMSLLKNLHGIHQEMNIKKETCTLDHQGISFLATAVRGPACVSAVTFYSLAYDAVDVMDIDNLATLSAQIQINIMLRGRVSKPSVESMSWLRDGALPLRKPRRLYKTQPRKSFGLCSTLCYWDDSEWMKYILIIITWHIMCFHTRCLTVLSPEGATEMCTGICHRLWMS